MYVVPMLFQAKKCWIEWWGVRIFRSHFEMSLKKAFLEVAICAQLTMNPIMLCFIAAFSILKYGLVIMGILVFIALHW